MNVGPRRARTRGRLVATLAVTGLLALGPLGAGAVPTATAAGSGTTTPAPAVTRTTSAGATVPASATPIATTETQTTTTSRGPLPWWAILLILALAVLGAVLAYPQRRRDRRA